MKSGHFTLELMPKGLALVFALSSLVECGASMETASDQGRFEPAVPAVNDAAAGSSVGHDAGNGADERAAPRSDAQEQKPSALEIPTECATSGAKICAPPTAFVAKLCQWRSADVTLSMFRKGTPWTRGYIRRPTQAWYMGARQSSPVHMTANEEVIVLATRGGTGGAQVSGSGGYDVLRWDGQCVSVIAGEVRPHRPHAPASAPILWHSLSDATRKVLTDDDPGIKLRVDQQQDRCGNKGSARRCTQMTAALTQGIAEYVRRGGRLPPTRLVPR
jgi:hypothetical protein